MAKKTTTQKNQLLELIDLAVFLLALGYMQSVLTVAHHTSQWVHNGSTYTVGPPNEYALVVGLILAAYSWNKKWTMTKLMLVSLTIFATASIFWLSGLRTNFYF